MPIVLKLINEWLLANKVSLMSTKIEIIYFRNKRITRLCIAREVNCRLFIPNNVQLNSDTGIFRYREFFATKMVAFDYSFLDTNTWYEGGTNKYTCF